MLDRYNDETILNKYIDYLADKGKIISIKDTTMKTKTTCFKKGEK